MTGPSQAARRLLSLLLRTHLGTRIARWIFGKMIFPPPAKRLRQTEHLVAFDHPFPSYPVHILLVPRREVAGLQALGPEDEPFLIDLFLTVQDLVEALGLEPAGYSLIANGGGYQDFPYLHFHLISGEET